MAKLIGTDPNQVPTNGDLGDLAYQNKESVKVDELYVDSATPELRISQSGTSKVRLRTDGDNYINTGQNLGVGTNSPSFPVHITSGEVRVGSDTTDADNWADNLVVTDGDDYAGISILSANNVRGCLFFGDGTGTAAYEGAVTYNHANNKLELWAGHAPKVYLNTSGNLEFNNGSGIDFSASQGSGASSSVLDDYEEGTWTPTYIGSGGGSVTYSLQSGKYTKVGNLVSWSAIIRASRGTLVGALFVRGFPFSANGENGHGCYINFTRNWATDMPNMRWYMQNGTTGLSSRKQATNATSSTQITEADMGTSTDDNYLYISGEYYTS